MKIAIVVVARDADVLAFFDEQKGAVVPRELREGNVQYNPLSVNAACSDDKLFEILLGAHKKHDAVGVLVETGNENRLNDCSSAVFLKTFNAVDAKGNMKNYFGHSLTRWLKNLHFVSQKFNDLKFFQCLALPGQSFAAPELTEIFRVCRTMNDEGKFLELLETKLKAVRNRRTPKKRTRYKAHFLKDDEGRYFGLGQERHGQSETRRPPHEAECSLTASARFGVTLDRYRHFNVSLEGDRHISGKFHNCHAVAVDISPCSHVNMFPNGFIR
ncbi:MAG: hypothetical protein JKY25_10990 [Robiginitomaculum sp.]|nr:hypothetical protein [Robiginitomaculum sp.]